MKKILFFVLAAFVALSSCEQSTQADENTNPDSDTSTPDPDQGGESTESLTATLMSVESNNIVISVNIGTYSGNYYVGCAPASYHPGDAVEFAELFIADEVSYGTDFSSVDNAYVFNSSSSINVGNNWLLSSDTEYCVAIFGVDDEGAITTDVVEVYATTLPLDLEGSIAAEVVSQSTSSIVLDITPSDEVGNYTYFVVSSYDYKYTYDSSAEYLANLGLYNLWYYGFDFDQADGEAIFNGAQQIDVASLWGVTPDVNHTILIFGMDSSGYLSSEITVMECMAGAADISVEGSVDLSLVSVSSAVITVAVTLEGTVGNYYVCPCRKSYLEKYYDNDTTTAIEAILYEDYFYYGTDFSEVDGIYIFDSSNESIIVNRGWSIAADTDYVILAAGINENGRLTTAVSSIEVSAEQIAAISQKESSALKSTLRRTSVADRSLTVLPLSPSISK